MHEGHRKRLIERLCNQPEGMQDHELLEALLFYAIRRQNTNPIAHRLIWSFGSLDGVLSASYDQLLSVDGVGEHTAALITCVGELSGRLPERTGAPIQLTGLGSFAEFLSRHFEKLPYEYLEFYFVDKNSTITFRKRYTDIRRNAVMVPPDEIARIMTAQNAAGIVVAHNHPGVACKPSADDDDFTAKLALLCSITNVKLHDHIIIGQDGTYSYFRDGCLAEFCERFNFNSVVGGKRS